MWDEVGADIRAVAEVCHKYGTALKVILETDALDAQQIAEAHPRRRCCWSRFCKELHRLLHRRALRWRHGGGCRNMLENAEGKAKIKGSAA